MTTFAGSIRARGEVAVAVAVADEAGDLVDREPAVDAVAQPLDDGLGIAAEGVDRLADEPAPPVFERLGQVPVEERDPGRDPSGEQGVDQAVVEVEARGIDRAVASGHDPRPGDREAIVAECRGRGIRSASAS